MFKINLPNKIFTKTINLSFDLMKFIILLIPFLFSHYTTLAQYQVGQSIYGDTTNYGLGKEVFLSGDGKVLAVSSYNSSGIDRRVKIYKRSKCTWVEDVVINVGSSTPKIALSNDGKVIVIGLSDRTANDLGYAGAIFVFENINDDWSILGSPIIGTIKNGGIGRNVSISGDGKTIAYDYKYSNDNTAGRTQIFKLLNNNWVQIGDDIVGENTDDALSRSAGKKRLNFSYDGTKVAVGSPGGNNPDGTKKTGYVRIFEYSNNSWKQIGTTIYGANFEEYSGISTSLSHMGNVIAIGRNFCYEPDFTTVRGGVKIFEFKNDNWIQVGQMIQAKSNERFDNPSISLSADGSIIAVGVDDAGVLGTPSDPLGGGVNIYKIINSVWTKICGPIAGKSGDKYANTVSLSDDGSIVAVTAQGNSDNGYNGSGMVQVFNVRNVIKTVNDCEFFTWTDGVTYYESNNTAKDTFITSDGCDSVVTLNLTITKVNADVTVVDESTLRAQAAESGTTYQWLNCADLKPIPGETNATFTATSSGEYAVEVTFNNCVKKSECFTISSKADINVLKSNYKIQLFPNPTSDKLILSLEGIERADISLTDIHGKVILHKLGLFDKDFISLSNLESGIYFVKVKTSEFSKEIRVIKQ